MGTALRSGDGSSTWKRYLDEVRNGVEMMVSRHGNGALKVNGTERCV